MSDMARAVNMVATKLWVLSLTSGTQTERKKRMQELSKVLVTDHQAKPAFADLCYRLAVVKMLEIEGDAVVWAAELWIKRLKEGNVE